MRQWVAFAQCSVYSHPLQQLLIHFVMDRAGPKTNFCMREGAQKLPGNLR